MIRAASRNKCEFNSECKKSTMSYVEKSLVPGEYSVVSDAAIMDGAAGPLLVSVVLAVIRRGMLAELVRQGRQGCWRALRDCVCTRRSLAGVLMIVVRSRPLRLGLARRNATEMA